MLCKIGEIEVWRILEINAPFMTPEELFPTAGPDVTKIIEEHVPNGICLKSGRLILPVQGFLLKTPSHVILVDSCVGNDKSIPGRSDWHMRAGTRFEASFKAAGVEFDDVDYVLCTHLHTDHVGWNTRLVDGRWVPTFPNARYMIPSADEQVYRAQNGDMFKESVLPVIEAGQAEMVEAGHMLGDYVTLLPTPGHTAGHVSVKLSSGDQQAVITGDALHSTVQCAHPDWHFKYDADANMAVASRKRLLEDVAESGCILLGSHFALPSIGRVTREKGTFRWIA